MKICYIAHAIGGNIEANLADLRRIIYLINAKYDVVPFCPYYADVVSLNDNDTLQRQRGIKNGEELLRRGFIDELWLTGSIKSRGMIYEEIIANEMRIPVFDFLNRF